MKKIFLATCLAICITQFAKSQTTQTQYEYITTYLVNDIKNSQSLLVGYELVSTDIKSVINKGDGTSRTATLQYFRRKETGENVAIVVNCQSGNDWRCLCIPMQNSSADIWDKAFKDFRDAGSDWDLVFTWALIKLASKEIIK